MISSRYPLRYAFILAAVVVGTASAQTQQMVEVSLTNIKTVIAREIQVNVETIPLMIKVPAETAKVVCNVTAEGLAPQTNSGVPSCPADKTSTALNDAVKQEIMKAKPSK